MRDSIIKYGFLVWLGWLVPAAVAWAAKDSFPVPPGTNLVAVTDKLNFDNLMTMQVRKFDVEMSVEEVLNYYRGTWKDQFVENDMPPWKVISTKQGGKFYTVQVQASGVGKSWGYLGVSDLPRVLEKGAKPGATAHKNFPMMNGSTVMNDLKQEDPGRKARTLWINNGFSVASNAEYYRSFYTEQGWTKLVDQSADASNSNHVLVFQQGDKTINMSIDKSAEGGTNVVLTDIKNGLF
jgi:hypothetical protein